MKVVLIGSEITAMKDELKRRIEKMGGSQVTKLESSTAFVISTREEIQRMNRRMQEVRERQIRAVDLNFLSEIEGGSPEETIAKINSSTFCGW